jgi:hypothetical protein
MMDTIPTTNSDWLNWEEEQKNLREYSIKESLIRVQKGKIYIAEILNRNEIIIKEGI